MTDAFAFQVLTQDADIRQSTRGNRVFDTIRQAIVQLQVRPGYPLSEAELARQLGVSRQPVREAFIKLAEISLVEVRPQRGTFVVMISQREVRNARFIREAIEVAIARKAAMEATPAQVAILRDIIEDQQRRADAADHAGFMRLDEAFHEALAHSADCDHAWRVLENLKAQMDRVRWLAMPDATPLQTLIDQHKAIVDAIEGRSPDAAEEAVHIHLREILTSLPQLAARYPDLFVD